MPDSRDIDRVVFDGDFVRAGVYEPLRVLVALRRTECEAGSSPQLSAAADPSALSAGALNA